MLDNSIRLKDGSVTKYETGIAIEDIIAGSVLLTPDMSASEITDLANHKSLTLDISELQNAKKLDELLPTHIKASLYTDSEKPLRLTYQKTVGDIDAENAVIFFAEALQTSGDIDVENAVIFFAKALQTSGCIVADKAQGFFIPALQTAKYIVADKAQIFFAKALQKSGNIDAKSALDFIAPVLQKCGNIYAPNASNVTVSKDAYITARFETLPARSATL